MALSKFQIKNKRVFYKPRQIRNPVEELDHRNLKSFVVVSMRLRKGRLHYFTERNSYNLSSFGIDTHYVNKGSEVLEIEEFDFE